jgi:hypothetical protein
MDCGALAKVRGEMSGSEGGRAAGTACASGSNQINPGIVAHAERKWRRILRVLVDGKRLNRFAAERYGDHALNSTISQIGRMGVRVSREPITLAGRFGTIYCRRYWIEPADAETALAILRERP